MYWGISHLWAWNFFPKSVFKIKKKITNQLSIPSVAFWDTNDLFYVRKNSTKKLIIFLTISFWCPLPLQQKSLKNINELSVPQHGAIFATDGKNCDGRNFWFIMHGLKIWGFECASILKTVCTNLRICVQSIAFCDNLGV